jgi:hypothetical protein
MERREKEIRKRWRKVIHKKIFYGKEGGKEI